MGASGDRQWEALYPGSGQLVRLRRSPGVGCSMRFCGIVLLCFVSAAVFAADWPQWRGPNRNGISAETGWAPTSNPRRVWTAQVGQGFSSVAVVGGRVYTMGNAGGKD